MKQVIVWTPNLDANNGQNIVTRRVVSLLGSHATVVQFHPGRNSFARALAKGLEFFFRVATAREQQVVYAVISRSWYGALRDVPVLLLSFFSVRSLSCSWFWLTNLLSRRCLGPIFASVSPS